MKLTTTWAKCSRTCEKYAKSVLFAGRILTFTLFGIEPKLVVGDVVMRRVHFAGGRDIYYFIMGGLNLSILCTVGCEANKRKQCHLRNSTNNTHSISKHSVLVPQRLEICGKVFELGFYKRLLNMRFFRAGWVAHCQFIKNWQHAKCVSKSHTALFLLKWPKNRTNERILVKNMLILWRFRRFSGKIKSNPPLWKLELRKAKLLTEIFFSARAPLKNLLPTHSVQW